MKKGLLIAALAGCAIAFFAFDLHRLLTLEYIKSQQAAAVAYYEAYPLRAMVAFFVFYVAVTTLSIPGGALLTIAGGAIFGLVTATILISFASSIGALAAFLVSRYLLRDFVQRRFRASLGAVNAGVARDGAFYLFAMRLVPAIPFFVVNVVMGLTPIRPRTYYWVSQLGMLPGTVVYVNAGAELARIESVGGILTPGLIGAFVLLAVFPFVARALLDGIRRRRLLAPFRKPRRFDRNLIVIGAGSAGLVSAYIAAAVKAKVTLIERERMGGDCLNTGCVPSKALIRTARFVAEARRCRELGISRADLELDFAEVMARVERVIREVAPHDSVERYTSLGVDCVQGEARVVSPWQVDVRTAGGLRSLTARAIVVATGARPSVPAIAGLDDYLTSENVWSLRELPTRLLVLGGGPIGCELAQCFARLGSQVTLVQSQPRLLPREDPDAAAIVTQRFEAEGIRVLTGCEARQVVHEGDEKLLVCARGGEELRIAFDQVLCALGRTPATKDLGLEGLGVRFTGSGAIEVDELARTRVPTVYACGDAAGPYQFTHAAAHSAWYATVNALFGGLRKTKLDYRVMPWCTFTEPEVARVGLNETEAAERGIAHEATLYRLDELDRAIADEATAGFVKVLTVPGKDRLLGVTIVGAHAGDMIAEYVTAMRHRLGLNRILGTIHIYPTFAEANKHAAGRWRQAHVSPRVLRLLARYHSWMRA